MKRTISLILSLLFVLTVMPVTANAYDGTVKAIEFTPRSPREEYFETDGYWDTDGEGERYYFYNVESRGSGDKLTIIDNNDVEHCYTAVWDNSEDECYFVSDEDSNERLKYTGDGNEFSFVNEQDQVGKHLQLGKNRNILFLEFRGARAEIPVTIVQNPVTSFEFIPVSPFTVIENARGHWDHDDYYGDFFNYDSPEFREGDRISVIFAGQSEPVIYTYDGWDFLDENEDEIPYRDELFRSKHNEPWTIGGNNKFYIQYCGREVQVSVTVVANPVTKIEYTRTGKDEYIEGDTFHDDWDNADYYDHPRFREGDKLTVFEGDKSTVYVYTHDDEWNYFFENENDPTDTISTNTENGVCMEDHQNQTPWVLGNQNKFYVEYMGQSATLYAEVKKNPVKSIAYTRANPVEYYEEDDGRFEDGVFIYYLKYARAGDKLLVTDTNDVTKTYTCTRNEENYEFEFVASDGSVIEENAVRFSDDQRNTPWTVGKTNAYTVTYSGKSVTLYAEVKKNPVASIVYTRSESAVIYDTEGWNNGEGGLRYETPYFLQGDTLTLNYSDGTTPSKTYTFTQDDELGRSEFIAQDGEVLEDVHTGSNQWDEPWTVGDNYYYVEYLGVRSAPIKVTIKKNTIKAIQVVKLNPVVLFEGDCHTEYSMMTGQPFDCYDIPWFQDGDKIIVTEDDDTTKEFVYTHNDEQDTSDFVCGNEVLEGSIYTYSNQAWKPWAVGEENSYFVSFRGLEYEIPVTIAASNIKSISFELAKPDELVFNEYEEGKGEWRQTDEGSWYFYAWFFADFRESTLTITYKDNSTSVYVVKFDSEDVGAYFENVEDSNDKLYQSDVELFDRELNQNWTPETRNVLYMKYKGVTCEIPVTINHVFTHKNVPATCTAQGYTLDTCSACHAEFKSNFVKELGHSWNAGKVTKKATAKAAGIFEYTCTRCGAKKKVSIKKSAFKVTAKKKSFAVKATAKTTLKAKKLYTVKNKNGKVSYKISKKVKGISVAKNGNITVQRGLTAGKTYSVKIKVTDAGNAKYAKVTKTITVIIKVK